MFGPLKVRMSQRDCGAQPWRTQASGPVLKTDPNFWLKLLLSPSLPHGSKPFTQGFPLSPTLARPPSLAWALFSQHAQPDGRQDMLDLFSQQIQPVLEASDRRCWEEIRALHSQTEATKILTPISVLAMGAGPWRLEPRGQWCRQGELFASWCGSEAGLGAPPPGGSVPALLRYNCKPASCADKVLENNSWGFATAAVSLHAS